MSRFSLPALAAGLLLATTTLASAPVLADDGDDAPRARGHALGAEMAANFSPEALLHPGQSIDAATDGETVCAAGEAGCETVALDR